MRDLCRGRQLLRLTVELNAQQNARDIVAEGTFRQKGAARKLKVLRAGYKLKTGEALRFSSRSIDLR